MGWYELVFKAEVAGPVRGWLTSSIPRRAAEWEFHAWGHPLFLIAPVKNNYAHHTFLQNFNKTLNLHLDPKD